MAYDFDFFYQLFTGLRNGDLKITPPVDFQEAGDLASKIAMGERSIILVPATPKAEPVPGSDEEIDAAETKLNNARAILADALEATRHDALERELPNLEGKALVAAQNFLTGCRPRIQKLRREVADLAATHRDLIEKRKERDRVNPPALPQVPFVPSGMRCDMSSVFFGY